MLKSELVQRSETWEYLRLLWPLKLIPYHWHFKLTHWVSWNMTGYTPVPHNWKISLVSNTVVYFCWSFMSLWVSMGAVHILDIPSKRWSKITTQKLRHGSKISNTWSGLRFVLPRFFWLVLDLIPLLRQHRLSYDAVTNNPYNLCDLSPQDYLSCEKSTCPCSLCSWKPGAIVTDAVSLILKFKRKSPHSEEGVIYNQ